MNQSARDFIAQAEVFETNESRRIPKEVFKSGRVVQNTTGSQIAIERSDSSQGKIRDPRDVVSCDDTRLSPLYWAV
jgi:hypothetical protein